MIGARELAAVLGKPEPTDQQVAVIEAPLEPMLVVAGAGSGKTATMTDRVVYLVANEIVAPSEILGLTFTRKAASELAGRIERHLRALARWRAGSEGRSGVREQGGQGPSTADHGWLTERPRISTYNAYAGQLVNDHGVRLGIEADQTLLSEAGRYQVATQVVERWTGDLELTKAPITVVRAVVTLAGELAEHLSTPEAAAVELHRIADGLADALPTARKKDPYADVAKVIGSLRDRASLMPLVAEFSAGKRARAAMDFPDQVAAAATLARQFPVVGRGERDAARVVLLDEYQDTSVAQLEMLQALFAHGHPVTAVGDPHQGIYGWRGASAGALLSFPEQFPRADGGPAPVAHLTTSWRNDEAILAAANLTSAPLRDAGVDTHAGVGADDGAESDADAEARAATDVPDVDVPPLLPRPGAGPGVVRWTFAPDSAAEATALARALRTAWRPGERTAAVLCRKRSQFEAVRAALAEHGVPAQVVGLAGLLRTPEVSDVRAVLTAAYDPSRGDALLRLLTGPSHRLGASDLFALSDLARRRTSARRLDGAAREDTDTASIVEALEMLPQQETWTSDRGRSFTPDGLLRLRDAATLLRDVRGLTHLALADLVVAVEQSLGLDLEVHAHAGGAAHGRADLDELAVVAAEFEAGSPSPTLGSFLAWLDAADEYERGLDVAASEPDPTCVQIMTIHAAKGLEWDVVGVVGLMEGDFPSITTAKGMPSSSGWTTSLEALPYEMRGDASHLPDLEVPPGADHAGVRDALADFKLADGDRALREERRLAYVAFTRARSILVLTGCWHSGRTTVNAPSRFLRALVAGGAATPLPGTAPDALETPPLEAEPPAPVQATWPVERDGDLLEALRRAAELVPPPGERVPTPPATGGDPVLVQWRWQAETLLAELEDAGRERTAADPQHLSASAVVALATDPQTFALDRRRPIPARPSIHTRRGTQFHAWVERHFARAALLDVDDLDVADVVGSDEELAALQDAFLASPWADREPIAIEADVETPVAGTTVRCRIDAVFPWAGPVPETGRQPLVHVVDWKTGAPARGERAHRARELQLALYRLGWSRLHGVPIERVAASFHFVGAGYTHDAPMLGEAEVEALVGAQLGELRGIVPGR
ncbi:ATP-dependent DNA helicase [Serinibacter arcticus]|uniref:DNA 3'-5' helicase n=1 Tax=Serinibacter arcticus TaxID=1655435 RepID=A0A4Z1E4G4_9MICO|nr:ATP-dependent DNA helicase [Serinibacter arcticus]TGO06170.1 ATP-dependent DNA helicase [Serinibacter arcticus]